LQGYGPSQGFKKYSNDYKLSEYFDQREQTTSKPNLPNDSWHYQMQLQQTIQNSDDSNKTLDLDLSTFKTEKCSIESKHNPKH